MAKHRFYYLLQIASHRLSRRADRICVAELGISAAQLGALFETVAHPGCTQKHLAQVLAVHESAVTTLVRRLERAGVVKRRRSREDGRALALHPTRKGIELVAQARPLLTHMNNQLNRGFSAAELDTVARFLERVNELTQGEGDEVS